MIHSIPPFPRQPLARIASLAAILFLTLAANSVAARPAFAQDTTVRVSGFHSSRNRAALDAGGNTPFNTGTLLSALQNPANFGATGVVPCTLSFRPFVDTIEAGSLVHSGGERQLDVFFAGLSNRALAAEEVQELVAFALAGGIIYLSGDTDGEGLAYNPLFVGLGVADQFSTNEEASVSLSSDPPDDTPITNGPFGPIGPLQISPYEALDVVSTRGIATGSGLAGYVLAEGSLGSGYLVWSGDPIYMNQFMSDGDNLNYFLNLFGYACDANTPGVAIQVVDEDRHPVEGATVYQNGVPVPGTTDSRGLMRTATAEVGDQFIATRRILEQATGKGDHNQNSTQNWAYRVYLTSAAVQNNGALDVYTLPSKSGAMPVLTLRRDNTLIGFNIVASVEWDASDAYLQDLEDGFRQASLYFYDASDGQAFFEHITINDDNGSWNNADYQFKASNQEWPHTNNVGGITDAGNKRAYFGRSFDGQSSSRGTWANVNGHRTLVHEFGHYGLHLYDEYYYYGGPLGLTKIESHDTLKRLDPASVYSQDDLASSLMDSQYNSTEFCSDLAANPHNHDTEQHRQNGKSSWGTISDVYSDKQSPARWTLRTPETRNQVVAGPHNFPTTNWPQTDVVNWSTGTCSGEVAYHVIYTDGTVAKNVDVYLHRQNGRTLYQGKADGNGDITILGAANGDKLTSEIGFDLHVNSTIISCASLSARAANKDPSRPSAYAAPAAEGVVSTTIVLQAAPFKVDVQAVPLGGSSLEVRVGASEPLAMPPQVLLLQSGAAAPVTVTMTYDAPRHLYVGAAALEPEYGLNGVIDVTALNTYAESIAVSTMFQVAAVTAAEDSEIYSGDGVVELYVPAGRMAGASFISIVPTGMPAPLPAQLMSSAYEIKAAADVTLAGPASLTIHYDQQVAVSTTVSIYRWDDKMLQWVAIGGTVLRDHNEVAAPIQQLGVYVLVAVTAISELAAVNNGPTLVGSMTALTATVDAGSEVAFTWDFGDGTHGVGQVVQHTYSEPGTYIAKVTGSNLISSQVATTSVEVVKVANKPTLYVPLILR